ncbi:MAG TPA: polysaccharide deacetylase family protein [Vicinamibacterales bacterium]|nr:polysaccharide deacetylase family protein [Vicinamibacterales bacterium]
MTARVPFAERGGRARGLLDLATLRYPMFLFGGSVGSLLPVFHFHDETREWLEPRLRYLVENGYRTIAADDIARFVVDGVNPGPRAVALTFDDAWASTSTVVTPLLKQYGLRAILFAIPARMEDERSPESLALRRENVALPFVTWAQLRAMHDSGVWDIQSHTRSHAMVFSSDELIGFVTPSFANEPLLNRPVAVLNDRVEAVAPDALGTPLYVRRSRMSDGRRFFADQETAERCRDHVARNGGPQFFARPDWDNDLRRVAANASGTFESDDDRRAAIRKELADGRALLNEKLRTTTVRDVALPWGIAGAETERALEETGHRLAFSQRPLQRHGIRIGDNRHRLTRLNGKYLMSLPGRGRKWFLTAAR